MQRHLDVWTARSSRGSVWRRALSHINSFWHPPADHACTGLDSDSAQSEARFMYTRSDVLPQFIMPRCASAPALLASCSPGQAPSRAVATDLVYASKSRARPTRVCKTASQGQYIARALLGTGLP